ncbi:MAG: fibronectin type III domain-containing protein [Actinobacteria bacterium]|nr:fibronectin type III domain-containing protein [Actinomycetota bacterium]
MGARTRRFTSLATGSNTTKAAGIAALCAVMLLAGCGGSGGSASDASTPVIRGDVAEAGVSGTTVIAPGVPAAPTGAAGDGKVTVTVAQGSSGGTPATYTVTAVGTSKTCTVTGATGSCDVTGLTNATPYTFTATATNEGGTSGVSAPSNSVTPGAAATTATVRTVTFESGYAGLPTIYTQTGSSPAALLPNTFRWGSMSFLGWNTDRYGHLNNTGEWFADRAEYSFASDIVLYAQWGEPGEPYNIRAQVQGPGKVDVTFLTAPNPDGTYYTDWVVYELVVSKSVLFVSSKNVNAPGTHSLDNLPAGKLRFHVVHNRKYRASRPAAVVVEASAASATVSAPGTPPAPTVVAGTAKITATVAAGTSGGTPASYTVKAYTVNGTEAGTSCTVTGASGFCDVTALTAGSTYTVKAVAKNAAGDSGASVASSPVTLATVPGAPALTALSRRSKTEVWVTYSAPSSNGGKPITGYTVTATRNGVDITQSFPAEAGRVSVGPLTRYAVYTFTVRAMNSVGTSGPSNANTFRVDR